MKPLPTGSLEVPPTLGKNSVKGFRHLYIIAKRAVEIIAGNNARGFLTTAQNHKFHTIFKEIRPPFLPAIVNYVKTRQHMLAINFLYCCSRVLSISVGGGGQGGLQPPSWAKVGFTRANFLKEQ